MKQNLRRTIALGVGLAALAACGTDYGTDPDQASRPTLLSATGNIAATVDAFRTLLVNTYTTSLNTANLTAAEAVEVDLVIRNGTVVDGSGKPGVQADVAHAALAASNGDEAFYHGKVATAAFFAANMLPNLTAVRGIIENLDDDLMRLPEVAF